MGKIQSNTVERERERERERESYRSGSWRGGGTAELQPAIHMVRLAINLGKACRI